MSLTKYPEGSLRELWRIAFPLMLSSLSVSSMIFVDRLFLAHFSTSAMNAAVTATTLGWAFLMGWIVLANIAEVFVAQYNGAGNKEKLGEPVWQMIWISLASVSFFLPVAVWGPELIFGLEDKEMMSRDYFRWMMYFGACFPVYGALTGFFVGQGKTTLITVLAIVTNFINAFLDFIFIFGVDGLFPAMGTKGAALATGLSAVFQAVVLVGFFLSKRNRENHGTGRFQLQMDLCRQCVKIGLPGAVFVVIEIFGWAMFYILMAIKGEVYITVTGISQGVALLLFFFCEGASKAISTVAGNLIGAKRSWLIPNTIMAGVKMHVVFLIFMLVGLWFSFETLLNQFLPFDDFAMKESLREPIAISLIWVLIYIFLEGIRMIFMGALTAAGDTIFLLIAGSLSIWLFLLLPTYVFVNHYGMSVENACLIWVVYGVGISLLYMGRFLQGRWKEITITT